MRNTGEHQYYIYRVTPKKWSEVYIKMKKIKFKMAAGGHFFSHDLAKMPLFTLKFELEEQIMAQNDRIGEVFHLM